MRKKWLNLTLKKSEKTTCHRFANLTISHPFAHHTSSTYICLDITANSGQYSSWETENTALPRFASLTTPFPLSLSHLHHYQLKYALILPSTQDNTHLGKLRTLLCIDLQVWQSPPFSPLPNSGQYSPWETENTTLPWFASLTACTALKNYQRLRKLFDGVLVISCNIFTV